MMEKEVDKDGRMLYKFSHSTSKGGNVYIHKTAVDKCIENKSELRTYLNAISKKHSLIDPTIKIYDNILFFFFHIPKSLVPTELIESISKNLSSFADWDKEYIFTGVYDLQETFLKKELEKYGYDYEK